MFVNRPYHIFGIYSILFLQSIHGSIFEYFLPQKLTTSHELEALPPVPYEVSANDEKFLREATKLIGSSLSDLDICHHRVILKLKKSCHELNAEQLGKLSVMLLNCQSYSEGRSMYECTENMSLKDCTLGMDANTWNTYHLITNRAKAVCAAIRQEQFRGLTEITVNKLMQSAHEQISMMDKISGNQQHLEQLTSVAIEQLNEKNAKLLEQQKEMLQVSQVHRSTIEANLHEMMREKGLIKAGQSAVAEMLVQLKTQLDISLASIKQQAKEAKQNHAAISNDLNQLHENAFKSTEYILSQNEIAAGQFAETIRQLDGINETIEKLAKLLRHLENGLDTKLGWIAERVGGTETFINNIQIGVKYVSYLLLGMLLLVFVNAPTFYRCIFVIIVPINFACVLFQVFHFDMIEMSQIILATFTVKLLHTVFTQYDMKNAFTVKQNHFIVNEESDDLDANANQIRGQHRQSSTKETESIYVATLKSRQKRSNNLYEMSRTERERSMTPLQREDDYDDRASSTHSRSVTPYTSLLRNRTRCIGITVKGDQCRHAAISEDEYCRIHVRS